MFSLEFDHVFPYIAGAGGGRPLPRLPVAVSLDEAGVPWTRLRPLLDSGADYCVFDGAVAVELGWSPQDIADRAIDAQPVSGVGAIAPQFVAYRHRVAVLIALGPRFAALRLQVYLTAPNTLAMPVLGRHDFLEHVDFALVEAEQRFYLRFRDRSVLRESW